jgi:hypothetical protein
MGESAGCDGREKPTVLRLDRLDIQDHYRHALDCKRVGQEFTYTGGALKSVNKTAVAMGH